MRVRRKASKKNRASFRRFCATDDNDRQLERRGRRAVATPERSESFVALTAELSSALRSGYHFQLSAYLDSQKKKKKKKSPLLPPRRQRISHKTFERLPDCVRVSGGGGGQPSMRRPADTGAQHAED